VSAQIIPFPNAPASTAAQTGGDHISMIETALEVHDFILLELEARTYNQETTDPVGYLQHMLNIAYGPELAAVAESIFEQVYGADPYTFMMRLNSFRCC